MALVRQFGSESDFAPFAGGIRNIGTILMQMPALQARGRMLAAQQATEGAQADNYRATSRESDARTGLLGEQTMGEKLKNVLSQKQIDSITALQDEIRTNPPTVNPDGSVTLSKGLGDLLAPMMGLSTNPQQDAAAIKTMTGVPKGATPPKLTTVQPGGVVIDATGKPVYQNPSAAAEGQQYETETEKIPAVPAVPAIPATFHREGGLPLLHWGGQTVQDTPFQPAVPASGEKTITRKVLVNQLANALAQTNGVPQGASAPATQTAQPQPKAFDDENSARQAGFGSGDVVYLNGVGKVRLR